MDNRKLALAAVDAMLAVVLKQAEGVKRLRNVPAEFKRAAEFWQKRIEVAECVELGRELATFGEQLGALVSTADRVVDAVVAVRTSASHGGVRLSS